MFLFYCIMCHSIMRRCSAYYSFNDKLNYLLNNGFDRFYWFGYIKHYD